MGWASGSELASELIEVIKKVVKDKEARGVLYYHIIDKFEKHDCDVMDECLGIDKIYDNVYYDMHPKGY